MDAALLREKLARIKVWKRGAERAPHKPLLLLYAMAKCSRNEPRQIPFAEVDEDLRNLLVEFGPSRKSYSPEYPFWRLQNDGVWELVNAENVEARASNTDAKKSELLKYGVSGGFRKAVYELLQTDQRLLVDLAYELLDAHFPSSLHDDILDAVGLGFRYDVSQRRKRNPEFRGRVLTAYGFRCAVCGYDVRLANRELGLEAAHIKWHQAGGPDIEANGLALCVLHHKLFDHGALGVSLEHEVRVSELVHGTKGFGEWLLAYHGQPLCEPKSPEYRPREDFVRWHQSEVFRGPARHTREG